MEKKKQPVRIIPPPCGVAKAGRWRGKAGTLQIVKDQRSDQRLQGRVYETFIFQ